jgi:uncharacterized membrane protein (UPF0136 family)
VIFLILGGSLWGLFFALGSAKRHRVGRTALGLLIAVGGIGWMWRRRAEVAKSLVAGGCVVGVVGLVAAVWLSPGLRWSVILPTVGVGLLVLFFPAGWLWDNQPGGILAERFADRTPSEALADWIEGNRVRTEVRGVADRMAPGAAAAKAKRVGPGEWHVPVLLNGDPLALDPHALGGAINRTGADARDVTILAGSRLGTGTVVVSDRPPAPPRTVWQALGDIGSVPWPGPAGRGPAVPMNIGFDYNGRPIRLKPPGIDGGNTLIAGATGSGKSSLAHTVIADLCYRPDVALILLDPDGVEHGLYRDRATTLAQGADECARVIERLPEIMEARSKMLAKADRRFFRVGVDGPAAIVVIDEYAAIPANLKDGMTQWLARARKFGGGTVIATQRPQREVIPLIQRDNCAVRIALSLTSGQALDMTLGDDARVHAADILHCPLQGGFVARLVDPSGGDGGYWKGRSYLLTPPYVRDGDPIATAARIISDNTKHLRIDWEDLCV